MRFPVSHYPRKGTYIADDYAIHGIFAHAIITRGGLTRQGSLSRAIDNNGEGGAAAFSVFGWGIFDGIFDFRRRIVHELCYTDFKRLFDSFSLSLSLSLTIVG